MKKWCTLCLTGILFFSACQAVQNTPDSSSYTESLVSTVNALSEEELTNLTDTYLYPLNSVGPLLLMDWASVDDIPADDLIMFCSFNNLLGMEMISTPDGLEFVNNLAPAEECEAAIQCYFDVSTDFLRTSSHYLADENAYALGIGGGGGRYPKALSVKENGDLLEIEVGMFSDINEHENQPYQIATLTIRRTGDQFTYLSYVIEETSNK